MKIEVDRQKKGFLLKEEGKLSYYATSVTTLLAEIMGLLFAVTKMGKAYSIFIKKVGQLHYSYVLASTGGKTMVISNRSLTIIAN